MTDASPLIPGTARALLRERAARFAMDAAAVAESPGKAKPVKQLRTRARRLEASIRVLRPVLRKKRAAVLRNTARAIRRDAGAVRDADVIGRLLGRQLESTREPGRASALGYLVGHLGAQREIANARLHDTLVVLGADIRTLPDDLDDAVRDRKGDGAPIALGAVASEALRDEALTFSAASEQDLTDLELLHDMRKAGKRLRYSVEVFMPLLPVSLAREVDTRLKDCQERLGEINDRHVKILTIERVMGRSDADAVQGGLSLLRADWSEELDRRHAAFVRWWWDVGAAQQLLGCAHELSMVRSEAAVA